MASAFPTNLAPKGDTRPVLVGGGGVGGVAFCEVDLEPYIAPYLLTGLCDENEATNPSGSRTSARCDTEGGP